jgi:hypothetical protein
MRKINWYKLDDLRLQGIIIPEGFMSNEAIAAFGLKESDIEPVKLWCEEHHCGVRTSFDIFEFRNEQELTMFMLRWA